MKRVAAVILGTTSAGISLFVVTCGLEAFRDKYGLFALVACILMWVLSLVGFCGCMDD